MITQKKDEWLELVIPQEWKGFNIEHILKEVWQAPKGYIHQLRMDKGITVNGDVYPWSKELNIGDKLQIHMFPKEEYGVKPTSSDIQVLYEDDHIIIVNKPAGIDVHPTEENQDNTLSNHLAFYFLQKGIETKIRHIHRLDKETTGAVLFAKNALAGAIMDRLLEKRIIKRTYLALVQGKVFKKNYTINEPIGRDRHHATRRRVSPTGQEAITSYEIIKYNPNNDTTLVKLQLETGRTHQIRVHMSYIGHPIVGDSLYGGTTGRYSRQALHAIKISLPHPITNEEVSCIAPFIDNPPIFEEDILELVN